MRRIHNQKVALAARYRYPCYSGCRRNADGDSQSRRGSKRTESGLKENRAVLSSLASSGYSDRLRDVFPMRTDSGLKEIC
jgi:hypothetical protein